MRTSKPRAPRISTRARKNLAIEALVRAQTPQRHLGQHYGLLSFNAWLLQKLIERPGQEVEREHRRGSEAASLDQDWFLVKDLRRLHDLTVRPEHCGVGQSALHQLEAKQAMVSLIMSMSIRSRDSSSISESISP